MATVLEPSIAAEPVEIPWWSWAVLAAALFGSYIIMQENGLLLSQWETVHEFFHDGRHLVGVPCH